jgi:serine/threonine protein kinase
MELCECGSLQAVCQLVGGSIAEVQLRAVCADVLQGLRYLHEERRTVHRDVKGANLLLTKGGVVKIADFGVSTALDASGGIQSTVIGTPQWMAPEVRAPRVPSPG